MSSKLRSFRSMAADCPSRWRDTRDIMRTHGGRWPKLAAFKYVALLWLLWLREKVRELIGRKQ